MAYQYPLNGGRINASISGNSTSAGAGYQLVSTGTLVLAGGNNVTLNQNANSISIAGPSLSNSNGFTFGTNGSVVTASYAGGGSVNFSAGTTSGNLASVNLSNANGVSFGLNAGTITASHNALTSQSAQALSASNGSFAFQTAGFSNANGVTFGTSAGSIMTASVNTSYAASNHSHGNPTLNLTNLSGTTASASNGLTLSLSAASQSVQTQSNIQGIIANGSTNRTGDVSFANSNGVTFGLSNNTITASVAAAGQTNQTLGLYASGNSTGQSSSSTMDARSLSISAQGGVSAGFSGGMMQMSAPAVSSLSQTGIVSISRNGNTISIGAPAFSAGMSTGGNTSGTTGTVSNQLIFAGGNNITLSQNTGAGGNTISIIGAAGGGGGGIALANSQTTYTSGTANLVGSGAISVNSTTGQSYIISAPAQSNLSATGAVSISNNGNTISIGAPAFSAGMSTGGNTSGTTGTVSNQLIFAGGNNITLSQNTGAGGNTISIIGGGGGGLALSANALISSGTASLAASGALTASVNGQTLNLSAPAISSMSVTGALSMSVNGSTVSLGVAAQTNQSLGLYASSNTVTNATTSGSVDARSLTFHGVGNASVGISNGSVIISASGGAGGGGLALSANALISSGTASLAASGALTASVNGQTLNLSVPATSSIVGVNGITISTSGGTISISGNGNGGGGGGAVARWEHPTAVFTTLPAIVNNSLSLQHVYMPFNFSGTEMKIGGSLSMGTHTSASTGSATINLKMGIYTLSGSTLSLLNSGSYSTGFGVSSNSTASYNGMRQFAVTGSFNLSAGEYWVGAILSTATNYASNPLGYTVYGNSAAPTAASNAILSPFGSAVTASPRDVFLFQGMYGTTTTALPTAIQGSQINNSAASFVQRAQFYHAIYSATY